MATPIAGYDELSSEWQKVTSESQKNLRKCLQSHREVVNELQRLKREKEVEVDELQRLKQEKEALLRRIDVLVRQVDPKTASESSRPHPRLADIPYPHAVRSYRAA